MNEIGGLAFRILKRDQDYNFNLDINTLEKI